MVQAKLMELTSERDDVKSRREQQWEEAQKSLSTIDKKHSAVTTAHELVTRSAATTAPPPSVCSCYDTNTLSLSRLFAVTKHPGKIRNLLIVSHALRR